MPVNKFIFLLINFVWMSGLFGAIFALLYLVRYRQRNWWHLGSGYYVPRTLAPLYGAVLLFCLGLALHAYVSPQQAGLWIALIWALLALLFAGRLFTTLFAGFQDGWDLPVGGDPTMDEAAGGAVLWSVLAAGLLVVNLALVGWATNTQVQAGALVWPLLNSLNRPARTSAPATPALQQFSPAPATLAATPTAISVTPVSVQAPTTVTDRLAAPVTAPLTVTLPVTMAIPTTATVPTTMTVPATATIPVTATLPTTATGILTATAAVTATGVVSPALAPSGAVTTTIEALTGLTVTQSVTNAVTVTLTTNATPALTATAGLTLPLPTATPLPPTPTATPRPRPATPRVTPTITPTITPTVTPTAPAVERSALGQDGLSKAAVTLVEPNDQDTLSSKRPFRWQPTFTLPAGYAFEVVFWEQGQDPLRQGKGYGGLAVDTQINISPGNFRQRNAPEGEYHWGVLLVTQEPYQRVKYLGGDYVIYVKY